MGRARLCNRSAPRGSMSPSEPQRHCRGIRRGTASRCRKRGPWPTSGTLTGGRSWSHLIHSVRTGEPAFEHAHGLGVFDYLKKNPDVSAVFNEAMSKVSARSGTCLVQRYDLSGVRKVVDVG